jgi:hypothetical protein
VQDMPSQVIGTWRINGRAVVVTQSTTIKGSVRVGVKVKVTGISRADGSVLASKIKKKSS